MTLFLLCLFAFLAGFVDSIAGGGGLVQLPAVFLFLPQLVPGASGVAALGTNKFSSVFGTALATYRYVRRVKLTWRPVLLAAVAAALFSFLGASTVKTVPEEILKRTVAILLVGVGAFTYLRRDFGTAIPEKPPTRSPLRSFLTAIAIGMVIGFYDGFFGPGTGTFLIFAFVGLYRFNFLEASAAAKLVNLVTNAFALLYFVTHNQVVLLAGIPMALANMAGSWAGTHLAIQHGARLVRIFFLLVVTGLAIKLAMG